MAMSSAYSCIFSFRGTSKISLINIIKNGATRSDPCGTPVLLSFVSLNKQINKCNTSFECIESHSGLLAVSMQ